MHFPRRSWPALRTLPRHVCESVNPGREGRTGAPRRSGGRVVAVTLSQPVGVGRRRRSRARASGGLG